MSHHPPSSPSADELRRRAEERFRAKATEHELPQADADAQRLLHELQVRQIELEMQNEELQRARNEMETSLMKFTDSTISPRSVRSSWIGAGLSATRTSPPPACWVSIAPSY